jgi:hypothetical protein
MPQSKIQYQAGLSLTQFTEQQRKQPVARVSPGIQ